MKAVRLEKPEQQIGGLERLVQMYNNLMISKHEDCVPEFSIIHKSGN